MQRVSTYLKMRVLGAIEFAPGNSIIERIKHVSQQSFVDEKDVALTFTWRTIQTWYSRYKKNGITAMASRSRRDKGLPRKVEPELLQEVVEQVLPSFHGNTPNLAKLYRVCIERGLLQRDRVAPNTFRRLVKHFNLLMPAAASEVKKRLAFAKAHANQMWQADTMFGPYVGHDNGRVQSKLIAYIDDASRLCCHGEFFAAENTATLISSLRAAFYKRGVPEMLYVDNGSIYSSKEIGLICARVGTLLCHTPVRDGAAKGKVERFFRTVRMDFLSQKQDLSSLDTLNRAFTAWMENEYNQRQHSTIGMRPLDRFGLDLKRIRFLPPGDANDELFFLEQQRTVLADNTFSLHRHRFEAPRDLRSRKIDIRFERGNLSRVVVYSKGERMGEAHFVDFIANDRPPKQIRQTSEGLP